MKRASYREAIFWIANNDDTTWCHHDPDTGCGVPSVTACIVADLFGVDVERVRSDVIKLIKKQEDYDRKNIVIKESVP